MNLYANTVAQGSCALDSVTFDSDSTAMFEDKGREATQLRLDGGHVWRILLLPTSSQLGTSWICTYTHNAGSTSGRYTYYL
jgi:hypothetical protein